MSIKIILEREILDSRVDWKGVKISPKMSPKSKIIPFRATKLVGFEVKESHGSVFVRSKTIVLLRRFCFWFVPKSSCGAIQ